MVFIPNIRNDPAFPSLFRRLWRRRLALSVKGWEVHGPHQDMPYQVFIGWCRETKGNKERLVAVYPRRIYEIEDPADWWKARPEDAI